MHMTPISLGAKGNQTTKMIMEITQNLRNLPHDLSCDADIVLLKLQEFGAEAVESNFA